MATLKASAASPLARRISSVRLALKLSQEEVGERSGLGRLVIQAIEAGKNQASTRETLKGLARAFGAPLQETDDLIEGALSAERFLDLVRQRQSRPPGSGGPGTDPGGDNGGLPLASGSDVANAGSPGDTRPEPRMSDRSIEPRAKRDKQRLGSGKTGGGGQAKARRR